jgi:4-carboxymuconolactone decarboxylase
MADRNARIEQLKQKYGAKAIDNAVRLNPHDFPEMMEWRDEMDPHYARLWLDYTYGGLYRRGVLTDRLRLLVLIAQSVAQDEMQQLGSHIRSALLHGATPREVLEVILQVTVYVGNPKVVRAARVFHDVITELGRMDEIRNTQLPLDGRNAERSL